MTNIGVSICDLFMWRGFWRCSVFWEYHVYPNIVLELLWRAAFGFDQDLEPVFPKLWKGFWFWSFCVFLDYGSYSIAFETPFPLGNSFCFTKNHFLLLQKHPFRQIWRYNVNVTDLFFVNLSYFISLLLDLLHFSLELLFFLTTYALCRAPCAIAANQKQRENLKT